MSKYFLFFINIISCLSAFVVYIYSTVLRRVQYLLDAVFFTVVLMDKYLLCVSESRYVKYMKKYISPTKYVVLSIKLQRKSA